MVKSISGEVVPLKKKWEVKKMKVVNMNHVLVVAFDGSKNSSTEIHILGDNSIKLVSLVGEKYPLFMKRKTKKKQAAAAKGKELPR